MDLEKKKVGNPPPKPNFQTRPVAKQDNSKTSNSVSSLRSKFQTDAKGPGPAKPKPVISRAKPLPIKPNKPALPKAVNGKSRNANGNNNTDTSQNEIIVGRVETCYIAPSGELPKALRGLPDGQVDEGFVDEKQTKTSVQPEEPHDSGTGSTSGCECKYIAVADFAAQEAGEIGFGEGAIATLIEKAKSDWWYMKIEDKSGWVPSAFFKLESSYTSESDFEEKDISITKSSDQFDPNAVYSEIDDPSDAPKGQNMRCVVLCEYEATDETALSVSAGDVLEVIEQTDTWWFVLVVFSSRNQQGQEGWVPFDHLQVL